MHFLSLKNYQNILVSFGTRAYGARVCMLAFVKNRQIELNHSKYVYLPKLICLLGAKQTIKSAYFPSSSQSFL